MWPVTFSFYLFVVAVLFACYLFIFAKSTGSYVSAKNEHVKLKWGDGEKTTLVPNATMRGVLIRLREKDVSSYLGCIGVRDSKPCALRHKT